MLFSLHEVVYDLEIVQRELTAAILEGTLLWLTLGL
jgi:hypothetical protein